MLQLGCFTHPRSRQRTPVPSPALRFARACLIVGLLIPGCNGDRSANTSSESRSPAADTEHEHFPFHWPFTIDRASERLSQLVANPETASHPSSVTTAREFADLWLWLPLLAADSDMVRTDFEQIDRWSQTWAPVCRNLADNHEPLETLTSPPELQSVVRDLERLCQRERQRIEQLSP